MSSIYIHGVSMPKDGECIVVYGDGEVWHHGKRIAKVGTAIELPPHGRLGDLDKLEKMFSDIDNAPYSEFDGEEPFYSAEDAAQIIRLAPTIIEAEGGADGWSD